MELFYKSFNLVRAFLQADARVPAPVRLPDAEDRFVTSELEQRAMYPVLQVTQAIRDMSQRGLLEERGISDEVPTAELSEEAGLDTNPEVTTQVDGPISLTPQPLQ